MRVACYFMGGSDIACFTFVASGVFLVEIGQMPFSDFYPYLKTPKTLNRKQEVTRYQLHHHRHSVRNTPTRWVALSEVAGEC